MVLGVERPQSTCGGIRWACLQDYLLHPSQKRQWGRPGSRWRDDIPTLVREPSDGHFKNMCYSFRQVFGCKWVDEELSFVLTQSWIRWHSFGLECEPSILHPRHYRTCCSLLMTTVSSASSVPPSLWWYQGSGHWKWKKTHTSGSSWKMHVNAIIVIIDHLSVLDCCAWWSNS